MTRLPSFALAFFAASVVSAKMPPRDAPKDSAKDISKDVRGAGPPGWQLTPQPDGKNTMLVLRGPTSKSGRRAVATIVVVEDTVAAKELVGVLRAKKMKADLQGPQQIALQSGDRTVLQWILEGGFLLTVDADGDKGRLRAAKTLVSWWKSKRAATWKRRVGTRGE